MIIGQNYSTEFLLPIFFSKKDQLTEKFLNTYIIDINNIDTGNTPKLYILFEEEPFKDDRITSSYTNKDGIMYVYNIPEDYHKDYEHFMDSQYSQFSIKLKERIMKFYGEESYQYKIVTKHPERRKWLEDKIGESLIPDAELLSKLDIEKEVYKDN